MRNKGVTSGNIVANLCNKIKWSMNQEMKGVRLAWGEGEIPIQHLDGAYEALGELFGDCPRFAPDVPSEGRWLVALPAATAADLAAFGLLFLNAGIFTLTARKEI